MTYLWCIIHRFLDLKKADGTICTLSCFLLLIFSLLPLGILFPWLVPSPELEQEFKFMPVMLLDEHFEKDMENKKLQAKVRFLNYL